MKEINGCRCSAIWNTTLAPVTGTPAPAIPATFAQISEPGDAAGDVVYDVVIYSTAPYSVTAEQTQRSPEVVGGAVAVSVAALWLLFPAGARKRLRALIFGIATLVILPNIVACGSAYVPSATSRTVAGSAGEYYVTIAGKAFQPAADDTYFSVQIPVTIQ